MTSFGGPWTHEKLEIISAYLDAYTTALKERPFRLIYVDAFAGDGFWQPGSVYTPEDYKEFAELQDGSTTRALSVRDRPFDRFVFIEKDQKRSKALEELARQHSDRHIEIIPEDANSALPRFCNGMDRLDRAVVFLDPFATQVSWDTIGAIARTKKIDCWILFPLGAVARMMPRDSSPSRPLALQLDRVFGGRQYWQVIYRESRQLHMFDKEPSFEREAGSDQIANCYWRRLESVFVRVAPASRTFRNTKNSPMFELFFAAANKRGAKIAVPIAKHILERS